VAARPDVIVAFGNPAVRVAQAATAEIPIVMLHAMDPVAQGFVRTLARPGGNLTGFVFFAVSPAKQVELFKELVPRLRRVLVLVDRRDPTARSHLEEMRRAAETLKLRLTERDAADQADLERVFGALKPGDVDGVMSASITLHIKFATLLLRLASARRLPVAGYRHEAVQQGALFAYAPDDAAVGHRAATYVDKILKGAKPADLPVEQPTRFEWVVNLKAAKVLGLAIPPSMLGRADQVIE
jgi:putative ABC transport system substrate-binding protein